MPERRSTRGGPTPVGERSWPEGGRLWIKRLPNRYVASPMHPLPMDDGWIEVVPKRGADDMTWLLIGSTDAGVDVRIEGDPYVDRGAKVWIGGEEAEIQGVDRMRDGGTTYVHTNRGEIVVAQRRFENKFRPHRLDGETLHVEGDPFDA